MNKFYEINIWFSKRDGTQSPSIRNHLCSVCFLSIFCWPGGGRLFFQNLLLSLTLQSSWDCILRLCHIDNFHEDPLLHILGTSCRNEHRWNILRVVEVIWRHLHFSENKYFRRQQVLQTAPTAVQCLSIYCMSLENIYKALKTVAIFLH